MFPLVKAIQVNPSRPLSFVADSLRAEHERVFARLLADHCQAGSTLGELLPIEDVLAEVIQPLVGNARVLMLVLDGMSTSVARDLLGDLATRGWVEHTPAPHSRSSLCCPQ